MEPPGVRPGSRRLQRRALALSYGSGVDAAGFEPAIGLRRRIKSPLPWSAWLRVRSEPGRIRTDAGLVKSQMPDRARRPAQVGPSRFERPPRASKARVLPSYTKDPKAFRRVRSSAGPAVPPPGGRRRYHWWPRDAARMPSRSQRRRRRIPIVRFVRNRITSVSLGPDRGRADRTPTASSTDSYAALTPCPVSRDRRTRRASALNTLGSPPRADSVSSVSWRRGSWYADSRIRLYF